MYLYNDNLVLNATKSPLWSRFHQDHKKTTEEYLRITLKHS